MAENIKLKQEETGHSFSSTRQDDQGEYIPQVGTATNTENGQHDMASSHGNGCFSYGLGATAAEPSEDQPESYFQILKSQASSRSESDYVIDMKGINQSTPYVDQLEPKGVPSEGFLYEFDKCIFLEKTCNLDQLLNGLYLINQFPLIKKGLKTLAKRFPVQYEGLFKAVELCECERYADAKRCLVPEFNMENIEGKQVMPLLEGQLRHWFVARCGKCNKRWNIPPIRDDIALEMNDHSTIQAALQAYFVPPNGTCFNSRCGGQTDVKVIFDTGAPPLILPINLFILQNHIPSTQVINFREDVVLFNKRYMIFLASIFRPHDPPKSGGHYMSYVFRPEEGGCYDTEGRPIGNWYWYQNDDLASLEFCIPGSRDPVGSRPSYIYFIEVPPPSSEENIPTRVRN
ncbi:uncharacterized protein [Argopecten irradians]|uniref:uncharacterized protein n=1 Tax=Argopecten irradians TaxID=31199 RepID=UPI0037101D3C